MTEAQLIQIDEDRLAQVRALQLKSGDHEANPDLEMCVMEAVAYVAGEPWADHPECACPVITSFMISWNDALRSDEERTRLLSPLIPSIVGTRSTSAVEEVRSYMALDWLIRVHTPKWLDMVPALQDHAKALRDLDAIVDIAGATAAGVKTRAAGAAARDAAWDAARDAAWAAAGAAARDAAWAAAGAAAWAAAGAAARDAAWAAAWDAAGAAAWAAAGAAARDAAGAAAWDAAWDAARDAAWDAARDAAWDAAWDAARDAARDALKPTTEWLQISALGLVKRMIEVKA